MSSRYAGSPDAPFEYDSEHVDGLTKWSATSVPGEMEMDSHGEFVHIDEVRDALREQDETLAKVADVLAKLDAQMSRMEERSKRPGFDDVAPYFQGREIGEMAGIAQAAHAIRRALGMDTP